jgi:hypothetical protein
MEAVIFPDVERVMVAALKAALELRTEPYAQNVSVSTIKPAPDVTPYPERMIVVRADGGPMLDHVRKNERVGLTIWADTYEDANALSRLLEALVKGMTGEHIKFVNVVLSPVRVAEESTQECRYMTLELITKGSTL